MGFWIKFVGLLVDCRGEAGVSPEKAGLDGIFEQKEIGDKKLTTELVGRFKPESVRRWKSSGSERSERQSSQGKIECNAA